MTQQPPPLPPDPAGGEPPTDQEGPSFQLGGATSPVPGPLATQTFMPGQQQAGTPGPTMQFGAPPPGPPQGPPPGYAPQGQYGPPPGPPQGQPPGPPQGPPPGYPQGPPPGYAQGPPPGYPQGPPPGYPQGPPPGYPPSQGAGGYGMTPYGGYGGGGPVTSNAPLSGGPPGAYPISLVIEVPPKNSRGFAIPILGGFARAILLIPHIIVLYLIGIILYILVAFNWLIVLITGKAPSFYYQFAGGYLRWATRVGAYFFGLTDRYPPFSLDN